MIVGSTGTAPPGGEDLPEANRPAANGPEPNRPAVGRQGAKRADAAATRDGSRTRRWPIAAGIGAGAVIVVGLVVSLALVQPLANQAETMAATVPGTFRPTPTQWKGIKVEPVGLRAFQPEQVTEGNIAIDDDLTTPVFSPYSGRVTQLFAKLGDHVEHGTPLFAVEASEFVQAQNDLITALANLRTARTQLTQAQTNEKRAHELYLANGGSLKDWQQSQTDLASGENTVRANDIALAAVRNRLRILGKSDREIAALEAQPAQRTNPVATVPAPIAGTVTQRQVGLGQFINSTANGAANPVYTIGDLSKVWLIANVREEDAPLMRIGEPVEVRVLAFPNRVFKAMISWVGPSIDPNTHRLPVRADVENPDGALKPMMFASFRIITGEALQAPAVPQSALVYEGDTARVWVVGDDGAIASRSVRIGRISDGMVEILAGVSAGEKIVTGGTLFIDRAANG
ncbi:MAG: efflux RND transporter periplasmic adaptor subunit [Alphaproteobacteria bacterium]|nr:efflux RND transporter periplasmic adaptor subunit [Alphaproteobacteria bacterium]